MQELTVQEVEQVGGGILFLLLAALAAKGMKDTGQGPMGTSTGSGAMDAVVGGNMGA